MQCVGEDVDLGVFPADQLPIHPDRFSFKRHIHFLRLETFYAAPACSSTRTKKKPPGIRGGLRAVRHRLQAVLQYRSRLEPHGPARLDVYDCPGLRVTALACLARTDGEGSEPRYLEPFTFSDRFADLIECRIHSHCRGYLIDFCALRNGL